MRPSLVVISPPPLRKFTDLFDIAEDVGIQDSPAVTAVKAFDIAVLGRLSRLDVLVLDAVRLTRLESRQMSKLNLVDNLTIGNIR